MKTMQATYHLHYQLNFLDLGRSRRAHRKVKAYSLQEAIQKLNKSLSDKWANPISVEIVNAYRKEPDGWCFLNPDIFATA